jgi:acyl-CoA thioesterase-1
VRCALVLPVLAACAALFGCSKETEDPTPVESAAPAPKPADGRPVIVAFGDSLTAGHGSGADQNYPLLLQRELDSRGLRYRVVNAGVGGDTTSGGLERAGTVLELKPVMVILEFGGNDGLRGLPIAATRDNLDELIATLKRSGTQVVLAGMTLPPNYGPDYIRRFERIYKDLAAKHDVPLIPFFLDGVGGRAEYMQADGIHPNAAGNRKVAALVMKFIEPLLAAHQTQGSSR